MYLLGATLTKLLATVAAAMTVTAGLPGFQCRCPDGRVKPFCHGIASSPSGCCCADGCSSGTGGKPCCCAAKKSNVQGPKAAEKRSCCAHSKTEPNKAPERKGTQLEAKASCCVKTAVAQAPVYSAETTSVPVHHPGDVLVLWEPAFVSPPAITGATVARAPPGLLAAPPDITVLLCRFTC
ncbi:MAG: hypothetical protein K2X87_18815 [Gemmataceae bacterium]|nr:hypothetical protein [Gemmataceae bacterium]